MSLPRASACILAAALTTSCANMGDEAATLDPATLKWQAIAFGQSVDVNFATSVLPAKVGTNNVWFNGAKLAPSDVRNLNGTITIESRGGKIANTHDGITFYYTKLSTGTNFVLEADVTVEQFGPEINANPNGQEAIGLMVRDVLGGPRQDPLEPGYEEFPAASNMAVNGAQSKNRKADGELAIQTIYRDGVNFAWGNTNAIIPRSNYADVATAKTPTFKMKLERTNSGFVASYANADGSGAKSQPIAGANANILQTVDPKYMYVGFFAARNARVTFKNAKISLSKADTVNAPKYVAPALPPRFDVASPDVSVGDAYTLQVRSSVAGKLSVTQDGAAVVSNADVAEGKLFASPLKIAGATSSLAFNFVPSEGADRKPIARTLTVKKVALGNTNEIYVAADGKTDGAGTQASPLDLPSAIARVAHGGTIFLMDGTYSATPTSISIAASGSAGKLKKLIALNKGKVVMTKVLNLDGNFWHVKGLEVAGVTTGNGVRISGSNNIIEDLVVHGSADTGLQITAGPGVARSLWPANNLVLNSESFNNMDAAKKNADGFAAKIGVGDGNVFRGCISHHNTDDGWDLFNKIEDGNNGVVTIEDSIAYENGITYTFTPPVGSIGNGFKLGGEGLPVNHIIRNSLAFNNNMDGFTDNFNPGQLEVSNNVAFNNVRFNYIFRDGPFAEPAQQGKFKGNLSLRTSKATYSDAVVGDVDGASNFFYDLKTNQSANSAGKVLTAADFVSITPPAMTDKRLQRDASGKVILNGFLQRK